jgi:hypothetical protein
MTGTDIQVGAASAAAGGPDTHPGRTRCATTIFGAGQRAIASELVPATLLLVPQHQSGAAEIFSIVIAAADGTEITALGPFTDEEAVAIWRGIGDSSGLPLAIVGHDGALHRAYAKLGRLQLGAVTLRRRLSGLSGRRPRFLARRKAGSLPRRPLVYRECELAARGDGR